MRNTKAVVSLDAIRHNVSELIRCADGAKLMAVVKADGYGHGAIRVAKAALGAGAAYLGVAIVEEGIALREAGIQEPILVLGAVNESDCQQCVQYGISACVFLPEHVQWLQSAAKGFGKPAMAHLKIESGFHRIGTSVENLGEMLDAFAANPLVEMQGAFTHFATADMRDDSFVDEQLSRFEDALKVIRSRGFEPIVHVSNSAATMRRGRMIGGMVRAGIAMYGCAPSEEMPLPFVLRPALRWTSEISAINRVGPGETVGYGRTFTVSRESVIATIPVGYADGYARILGNRSCVLIRGRRCPVVGRVCMDQMMADVTDIADVEIHDEVVLLGSQGEQTILADELAQLLGTINYEVLVRISHRVPREYTDD